VQHVSFQNVPSFVVHLDASVKIPEIGEINFDLAFGGAFYAYLNIADVGLTGHPKEHDQLINLAKIIKKSVAEKFTLKHPYEEDMNFLYGVIFSGPALDSNADIRNVCIFADGEVDRSPTGTGVSGRLAINFERKQIGLNESLRIESILGTVFSCKIIKTKEFGPYNAVIPEVTGTAHITGKHEFFMDPTDLLVNGFILRK
jgi:trans-L-3-hydroxyproline dehydratase